ncbi:MAG TPA: cytochrome C oxidase subunit IV family protein [Planctomycetota bacterium]|nr:cytochrome C oxidase subunit IV family protein [Planctomycetota bacterium]
MSAAKPKSHGHDAPPAESHAAAHGDAQGAAHHDHPTTSTFITIWLVLAFLTVVELAVPQVYDAEWNRHTKMLLLVLLALGKATLVGLYFMHLKWEKPWLKWIALMPMYMGVAAVLLMCEEAWREMVM